MEGFVDPCLAKPARRVELLEVRSRLFLVERRHFERIDVTPLRLREDARHGRPKAWSLRLWMTHLNSEVTLTGPVVCQAGDQSLVLPC